MPRDACLPVALSDHEKPRMRLRDAVPCPDHDDKRMADVATFPREDLADAPVPQMIV